MFITRITKILLVCVLSLVLFTTSLANAGTVVTSREYKLILVPSNFNGSNPDDAVNDYWSELQLLVEGEPINIEMKGSLTLAKNRTVKFYDTPGTCQLKKKDLVFRDRVEYEMREVVVYEGGEVDLGNKDGEFSLTLWYDSPSSTEPKIAEISFKYKDKTNEEDYSETVASGAKKVFTAMQGMSNWVSDKSQTKTSYVYQYGTTPFCNKT